MAAGPNSSPVWFTTFTILAALVSSAIGQCSDGTYSHEGLDCCRCAAGLHLVSHCSTNLAYGKCEICKDGSYNSHPNAEFSCEPCTSCSQPNDNLEVDEPCTTARNTKCRCKKDHYCVSGAESCKLCHPCKECAHGVKVLCEGYNDTVCNDEGSNAGMIAIITVVVILIVGAIAFVIWKKYCKAKGDSTQQVTLTKLTSSVEERQRLNDVDLRPLLPDIAELIGWQDMQKLAIRSNIPTATIDSCRLDHPGDSQEQTLKLLMIWNEKAGMNAGNELINSLQKNHSNHKAEMVRNLLSEAAKQTPPV